MHAPKVMVIAVDGAEKSLLHEWAQAGVLPNLRALLERATRCNVENPSGLFSGSLWPSFYTGVSPGRHGRYCSSQLKAGTYEFARVHGFDSKLDTFWSVLSGHGRKVAVIDAPKTALEEQLNGVQITDWATEDLGRPVGSYPPGLASEVSGGYQRPPSLENALSSRDEVGFRALREQLIRSAHMKGRMSATILDRNRGDLFFTVFGEAHVAGHLCWHFHDPSHPDHDPSLVDRVGDIVRDVYVAIDEALVPLLERASPDTHVILYSNNGMGANYSGNFILDEVLLARDKMRLSAGRRVLAGATDALERVTPGFIHRRVAPIYGGLRQGMGLPLREFRHRTCFRTRSNEIAGGVRINLKGREPEGVVDPAAYDALCRSLKQDLESLTNTSTGEPIVRRVIVTRELYVGDYVDRFPDLLVEWTEAEPIEGATSSATGTVRKYHAGHRTGDHRPDGWLIVSGPSSSPGVVDPVSIYDLAPTVTGLLGVPFRQAEGTDVSAHVGLSSSP